ncbi:putative membrane protein [hydrothermal vent metagenome]|uniref:Putative membrane protein n=1 Tax=hydrothermal vent metagenome TaxID=652676 RepID=A0A3B0Z0V5_9ZZZZ
MIPTRRLFIMLWIWVILALPAGFSDVFSNLWKVSTLLLVGMLVLEVYGLLRVPSFSWRRQVQGSLAVGVWSSVTLEVHNLSESTFELEIFDHYPDTAETSHLPARITAPANAWVKLSYQILPLERGQFNFSQVQVRVSGMFGLLQKDNYCPLVSKVKIFPNFTNIIKYSLLAHDQRQSQMGIRRVRRRGEGTEFQQLREYRLGDSLKKIDWKATSRMNKLISREYQDERDQRIIFLVDCGRKMNSRDGELSHFDHTLNALLLLSYIALKQGDSVGLMTFGGHDRWLAPSKGIHMVNQVLNTVYDLKPSVTEPDYLKCATMISKLHPKRSLLVLITNLRDEESEELLSSLRLLKRRNLVLLASMREQAVDDVADGPVLGFGNALDSAAANQFLEARKKVHDQVRQLNILTIDVPPEQLAISMANKYFKIKKSGIL